ncbi:MAG: SdpI family protein [Peptococcaceae bacterium]|nr:SdpI family protein [Peptococcaceae bacterium]
MDRKSLLWDWPVWILLVLDLGASIYAYPHLPVRVPVHWNWQGQANGWGSPFSGAFLTFFITVGLYLLLLVIPVIDPRRANYGRFEDTYRFLRLVLVLFLVALHWVTLAGALGWPVSMKQVTMTAVAALFLVLGNVMGRLKQTWFVGIRTPWTLSDDGVWTRTHRLGGRVWVVAGLVGIAGGLMSGARPDRSCFWSPRWRRSSFRWFIPIATIAGSTAEKADALGCA